MQVHRDQLREVDADLARGVLSEAEADATRIEVSRRLLAAAAEEAVEARCRRRAGPRDAAGGAGVDRGGPARRAAGSTAPRRAGAARPAAGRTAGEREAEARANRPSQAEAEAIAARAAPPSPPPTASAEDLGLVARLRDGAGHPAGRPRGPPAAGAQPRGARPLAGGAGRAGAGDGDPRRRGGRAATSSTSPRCASSPPAAMSRRRPRRRWRGRWRSSRAIRPAATIPPSTLLQGGRPDVAYRIWSGLVAEGPPDAPWIAPARAGHRRGGADGRPAAAGRRGRAPARPPPTSAPPRRCRRPTGRR